MRRIPPTWIFLYIAAMALLVVVFVQLRGQAMTDFASDTAQARWGQWRDAVRTQPVDAPVKRRVPKSAEPPTLVLMRDHFAICLTAGLVFGSVSFYVIMVMVRGAFRSGNQFPLPDSPENGPSGGYN